MSAMGIGDFRLAMAIQRLVGDGEIDGDSFDGDGFVGDGEIDGD